MKVHIGAAFTFRQRVCAYDGDVLLAFDCACAAADLVIAAATEQVTGVLEVADDAGVGVGGWSRGRPFPVLDSGAGQRASER